MAVGVAFIGVGNISGIYLKNITTRFTEMKGVGLCDLVREKAEKARALIAKLDDSAAAMKL